MIEGDGEKKEGTKRKVGANREDQESLMLWFWKWSNSVGEVLAASRGATEVELSGCNILR